MRLARGLTQPQIAAHVGTSASNITFPNRGAVAQLGRAPEAMELLHRHFYKYERYDDVRDGDVGARVDYVFSSMKDDREFISSRR
jgi:transcriptional regulator